MEITRRNLLLSLLAAPFVPPVVERNIDATQITNRVSVQDIRTPDSYVLGVLRRGPRSFMVNYPPDDKQTSKQEGVMSYVYVGVSCFVAGLLFRPVIGHAFTLLGSKLG